ISGSFHVTTADYLRFADGATFYADLGRQSILTSAPIAAFGFLSGNPAGISLQGSTLRTLRGETVSVISGETDLDDSLITAPGGQINIASVASPGEVAPITTPDGSDLRLDGITRLGNVKIAGSTLNASGQTLTTDSAGAIIIRGGQIVVQNSSLDAGGNPGGLLRIGGEQLDLDTSFVNTGTRGAADHSGTAVDIALDGVMTMRNGSEIASSSYSAGRAGNIRIRAGSIVLGDDDPTTSRFASTGFYGDIGSRAFGFGRGGNIEITAESLTLKNGFFMNTAALNSGDAGNLTLRADTLTILDGASVSSNGFGLGRGGIVDIEVGDALISARNINAVPNCPCFTGVAAQAGYGSPGGAIRIKADRLQLLDGGRVSSALFSIGPGADIDIAVKELLISGVVLQTTASPPDVHAGIDARAIGSFATGNGGNIHVTADSITVTDGGFIDSSLFGGAPGKAGSIMLDADRISISDRGIIAASSLFGSGRAGEIYITADSLAVTGVGDSADPFGTDFTGLSTATGRAARQGGNAYLNLGSLEMTDKGSISSASLGAGDAGNIFLQLSGDLHISGGATIISSAFGSGNGGTIDITASSVSVAGVGQFNSFTDAGISGIASQTSIYGGNAGVIRITAGKLEVLDGAAITTETFGPGRGGNVKVSADSVVVSGVNAGLKDALTAAGADSRLAGARITTSSNGSLVPATGAAGNILITSDDLKVSDGGQIFAETTAAGEGGSIALKADRIALANGGMISSKSSGSGDAGNISVQSNLFRSVNSSVTTEAETADGGNIDFKVASTVELVNSEITAEVKSGVGTGGNITIDPNFVILNNSDITANAYGGPGGNIHIVSDVFLASPDSRVTASSTLSTQGTVDIQAPITDLSGTLAPLPETMLQAVSLMNQSCAARFAGGRISSLVTGRRQATLWQPGFLMPSPLLRLESREGASLQSGLEAQRKGMMAYGDLSKEPPYSINGPCSK
ncbi:MAG TPA: hypothetical protein VE131_10370, partial [Terriglobales bacterium]|nr:hypothetical protein [Terriglobales bacterium]